ncbi:MAG: DUF5329 family protein [Phycisphaerales bacterium]|nr:DUF5329 family protein [Phycisphaerales bacterium]
MKRALFAVLIVALSSVPALIFRSRGGFAIPPSSKINSTTPTPNQSASAVLTNLPRTITLKQRRTTPIESGLPASAASIAPPPLSITLSDITRGSVELTIIDSKNHPIAGPVVAREGSVIPFTLQGQAFALKLDAFKLQTLGTDEATVTISASTGTNTSNQAATPATLTERQKIDKLLDAVATLDGAVFIRNGSEHSPSAAADHLRGKLRSAGSRVTTARQFIDSIASASSSSGQDYTIRLKDGTVIATREFLNTKLRELEQTGSTSTTPPTNSNGV